MTTNAPKKLSATLALATTAKKTKEVLQDRAQEEKLIRAAAEPLPLELQLFIK